MAVSFAPSTTFQQWMRKLRISWMGPKAQSIMGAFAKVAGDLTYDWMLRANLEHLPEYASPISVGLTASERQLDSSPQETSAQLATRTTQAAILWRYAGTPLGMLLALHFSGFDGAVIVQQNGLAFQLQLPLPPIPFINGPAWNPQISLVTINESVLGTALTSNVTPPTNSSAGRKIPAGNSWWTFDSNTDCCSRFAIIYPSTVPGTVATWAIANFSSTDAAVVTWAVPFTNTAYHIFPGIPTVTDGGGGVEVDADGTSKSTTGVTIRASAPFTGSVDVVAYGVDISRLKGVISKWKPAKSTCVGVYALTTGQFFGWPLRLFSSGGTFGPSSINTLLGSF